MEEKGKRKYDWRRARQGLKKERENESGRGEEGEIGRREERTCLLCLPSYLSQFCVRITSHGPTRILSILLVINRKTFCSVFQEINLLSPTWILKRPLKSILYNNIFNFKNIFYLFKKYKYILFKYFKFIKLPLLHYYLILFDFFCSAFQHRFFIFCHNTAGHLDAKIAF